MATETRVPVDDQVGSTDWAATSGEDWECVDEGVDTPNDSDYIYSVTEADSEILIIDGTTGIVDADTVTDVSIRVRAAKLTDANIDRLGVTLWVDGTGLTQVVTTMTDTITDYTINHTSWNSDWTASEIAALKVGLESIQAGMPAAFEIRVYEVEVVVTYTPAPTYDPAVMDWRSSGESGLVYPKTKILSF